MMHADGLFGSASGRFGSDGLERASPRETDGCRLGRWRPLYSAGRQRAMKVPHLVRRARDAASDLRSAGASDARAGMTLLEMVCAVAILALLAAISLPRLMMAT